MLTFDDIIASGRATQEEALALFDSLEPVSVESMFGMWRGGEITTGHPMEGMLITSARPVLGTAKPTARLRMTEYRGVSTATMIYDAKPINDVFRRVSDDTVLGAMDLRGDDRPYFFFLRRDEMPVV